MKTNSRLHVAMISETFAPFVGGVAAQLQSCAAELRKRDVEVSIISKQLPATPNYEVIDGIPVYRVATQGGKAAAVGFIFAAINRLRLLQPTVIHAHELLLPTSTALLAHQLLRIPIVVTIHASGAQIGEVARLQRAKLGALRLAWLRRNVAAFVAISRATDADLAGAAIPEKRRWAIPNGIDMAHFAPLSAAQKVAIRQQLGMANVPTVVYSGRLSSEKRVNHLLDIWPTIRQSQPLAQLWLIGDGPEASLLRSRAGAGVYFAGSQADVAAWLQAADIFVMPSVSEGFSLATLEALAVGLPCVATAVGAIPEFISDQENGLLVPTDDKLALQNGLTQLLADGELRAKFSAQARQRVVEKYAIADVAEKLEKLYRQIAN